MPETLEPPTKNPGRTGKPSPASQATRLQLSILKLQETPGLAPSALAALSEQWLKLEQFKRSIRPPKSKRSAVVPPAPAQPSDDPRSHFIESPPTTTDDSP